MLELHENLRGVEGRGGVEGGVADAGVALLLRSEHNFLRNFGKVANLAFDGVSRCLWRTSVLISFMLWK